MFCTGGISEQDPYNPMDNKPHAFMAFFRDYVARFLNIPAIKGETLSVMVKYIISSAIQHVNGLVDDSVAVLGFI